jgi:catechol 2,3-dioxygenase-like lactoylglutathione lyase family enzyme
VKNLSGDPVVLQTTWTDLRLDCLDRMNLSSCMILPIRLDHCVIHVSNWERSNKFYRDVVGVEIVSKNGRSAYRFDNAQLNLHGPGVKANPLAKIPVPPGGSDLCFEWPGSIDEAVDHLNSHSVEVELGPVQRSGARGDGTSVYFRDPDGSLLEFIAYGSLD